MLCLGMQLTYLVASLNAMFLRMRVDEDDAASLVTSEEDDCISPVYHTLFPLEVHGSCYSEMQMILKASYQQFCCTSMIIEQHSFDIETFTYYCISTLCQKNQRIYGFFSRLGIRDDKRGYYL
uniref:Uncharacterized protein n=1 Tax=Glossina morsitans morsitans TaxID=37546 RepID=A0A1B0G5Z4_GLOMM